MPSLLTFQNVSLFADREFGISRLNIDIQQRKKYHIIFETQDRLNVVLGLIEGRYRKNSGIIFRKGKVFVQSDRLLLGDKVYSQQAGKWLALADQFFYFGGKRRTKQHFMDLLRAKHIRLLPIYKLRGDDKIKFTLLSLMFQENGIMAISRLPATPLSNSLQEHLYRIIKETHCTLCLFTSLDNPPSFPSDFLQNSSLIKMEIFSNNHTQYSDV